MWSNCVITNFMRWWVFLPFLDWTAQQHVETSVFFDHALICMFFLLPWFNSPFTCGCFSPFTFTAHSHVDASAQSHSQPIHTAHSHSPLTCGSFSPVTFTAHSHSQPIHKWKLLSAKCNSCMMDSRVLWHAKTPTRTHTYSHTHSDTHAHTHRHTKQQQSYHCMLPTGLAKEWVQSMRVLAMRQDTKLLSTPQSGRHSRARCTIQSTVQCMV